MSIAAVLNEEGNIVPIVEGKTIRIVDRQTKEVHDYENPAQFLEEGRRGAALAFAQEKGVTVFVAPPQTFCDLSYKKAINERVMFIQIEEGVSFETFINWLDEGVVKPQEELISENIASSHVPK